jgi:anion-transporting  ArsA/GET3 family ATPase
MYMRTHIRDRLRDFQFKMMELQDLFRDEERSEFVVVTIPTVLAVAESERLVTELRKQEVPVKHMVVSADVEHVACNSLCDLAALLNYVRLCLQESTQSCTKLCCRCVEVSACSARNVHAIGSSGLVST